MEKTVREEIEPFTSTPTAQTVVATLIDTCGMVLPPKTIGIIARHAKAMLNGGIPHDVVNAACYLAVLRGQPNLAQDIAGDLQLASSGMAMNRSEYEQKLALYAAEKSGKMGLLERYREGK